MAGDSPSRTHRSLVAGPIGGVFALQPRHFQGPLHDLAQPDALHRLFDEGERPLLDRLDGGFDIAVGTDHDHRRQRMIGAYPLQQVHAAQAALAEPEIEQDQIGFFGFGFGESRIGVGCGANRVSAILECVTHDLEIVDPIVNDKNICHRCVPSAPGPGSGDDRCHMRKGQWQAQAHPRSGPFPGIQQLDRTTMGLDRPADDGQAQSDAVGTVRTIRLQQAVAVHGREADAAVLDLDLRGLVDRPQPDLDPVRGWVFPAAVSFSCRARTA